MTDLFFKKTHHKVKYCGVTEGGGRTAPSDILQGVTPEQKIFVGKFTKNSGETRTSKSKKVAGWYPPGGWHPCEIDKKW